MNPPPLNIDRNRRLEEDLLLYSSTLTHESFRALLQNKKHVVAKFVEGSWNEEDLVLIHQIVRSEPSLHSLKIFVAEKFANLFIRNFLDPKLSLIKDNVYPDPLFDSSFPDYLITSFSPISQKGSKLFQQVLFEKRDYIDLPMTIFKSLPTSVQEFLSFSNIDLPRKTRREIKRRSMTFLDLPNEIIDLIFSHLKFIDRSKVRVNRRLREIEGRMKKPEGKSCYVNIALLSSTRFSIRTTSISTPDIDFIGGERYSAPVRISSVLASINRLAENIGELTVEIDETDWSHVKILQMLAFLSVERLQIMSSMEFKRGMRSILSVADFWFFSNLVQNCNNINISFESISLTADELIELNKMASDSLHFEFIDVPIPIEIAIEFADSFMGISSSSFSFPFTISRSNPEIEIYKDEDDVIHRLHNSIDTYLQRYENQFCLVLARFTDENERKRGMQRIF
ncbi:hypothetical protein PFISCL1PPCAC_18935 [Pristionchus fissidentatus]|uniref:F-box domain-containing protein n=1 Tax=Pristionchus fissidentatus TaxID=1538716 RepID=A0AAV5WAB2_9BILA|nr:hypothetical protein PFISCL1PPCAC_18935 [Pristionchus fissidentatus]